MTYIYLGHGMDLLKGRTPDFRIVPEGCTYSTITHTGISSNLGSVLNLNYISVSHLDLLLEPDKNYDRLSRLFTGEENANNYMHKTKLEEGDYHLKLEKERYTNNHCSFLFNFLFDPDQTLIQLYRSGLYNVEKPLFPLPRLKNESYLSPSYSYIVDTKIGMDIDLIPLIYKDSLFPTSDEIIREIKKTNTETLIPYNVFSKAVSTITKNVNSAELMERFPGNHYNFPCRDFENDNHSFNNSIVRKESINFQNRRYKNKNRTKKIRTKQTQLGSHHFKHFINDMALLFSFAGAKVYETSLISFKMRLENFSQRFIPSAQIFVDKMIEHIENHYFTKYDIDPSLLKVIIKLLKEGKLEGNVNVSLLEI